MSDENSIDVEGTVVEALRGGHYRVEVALGETRRVVLARLCGRMALNRIRVVPGDPVQVQISGYDLGRGRITYRGRRAEE